MKNIHAFINASEYELIKNINKYISDEIQNEKIVEAEFTEVIDYLNEVKNKIFADSENIIFTEIKAVVDKRETIKKYTDKVIGGHWTCGCDVYVNEYEEIYVANPDFGKKSYYICGKIKPNNMKNFKKFYIA